MTTVRCDMSDCAHKGTDVCTASRITLESGDCLSYKPYSQLMKERGEIDYKECRAIRGKKWS